MVLRDAVSRNASQWRWSTSRREVTPVAVRKLNQPARVSSSFQRVCGFHGDAERPRQCGDRGMAWGQPGHQVLPGDDAPPGMGDAGEVQDLAVGTHNDGSVGQARQIPEVLVEAWPQAARMQPQACGLGHVQTRERVAGVMQRWGKHALAHIGTSSRCSGSSAAQAATWRVTASIAAAGNRGRMSPSRHGLGPRRHDGVDGSVVPEAPAPRLVDLRLPPAGPLRLRDARPPDDHALRPRGPPRSDSPRSVGLRVLRPVTRRKPRSPWGERNFRGGVRSEAKTVGICA